MGFVGGGGNIAIATGAMAMLPQCCRRCWFLVSVALSCCVGARCIGPVGWLPTFEMVTEHFANPNLSVVVAKCCFLGFVV